MFVEFATLGGLIACVCVILFAERVLTSNVAPHRLGQTRPPGSDVSFDSGERVWAWQDREFLRATLVDPDVASGSSTPVGAGVPMCSVAFDHAPANPVELPVSMVRKDSEEQPEMVSANEWHSIRRRMILSDHPEVRQLRPLTASVYTTLMSVLVILHLGVGVAIAFSAQSGTVWFWTILLAATLGAFIAFALQQLTHEFSHIKRNRLQTAPVMLADLMVGTTGPNYTEYYFKYHMHHHANTSEANDPDLYYHSEWADPPQWAARSMLARFFWMTVYGLFTFEVLFLGHVLNRKAKPRMVFKNIGLMLTLLGKYSFMGLAFWFGGFWCFLYFKLAAGFSLGAFAHPYGGFWLMQHAAMARNGFQPTLSYSGSRIWHWLNLGELYHVEHHDFPWVPFTKIEEVRRIAPEYYQSCQVVTSVWRLTWDWLRHTDGTPWSDVAGVLVYPAPKSKEDIRRRPTPPIKVRAATKTDTFGLPAE